MIKGYDWAESVIKKYNSSFFPPVSFTKSDSTFPSPFVVSSFPLHTRDVEFTGVKEKFVLPHRRRRYEAASSCRAWDGPVRRAEYKPRCSSWWWRPRQGSSFRVVARKRTLLVRWLAPPTLCDREGRPLYHPPVKKKKKNHYFLESVKTALSVCCKSEIHLKRISRIEKLRGNEMSCFFLQQHFKS